MMSFTIDFFSFAICAADGFLAVEAGTRAARGRVGVWASGEDRQACSAKIRSRLA